MFTLVHVFVKDNLSPEQTYDYYEIIPGIVAQVPAIVELVILGILYKYGWNNTELTEDNYVWDIEYIE